MKTTVEIIFWLSVVALLYTYAGYPLLVFMVSRLRPRAIRVAKFSPSVSVIITAYNEERDLAAKLENTLALDYPRELMEIIVASDASSDRTDEIARQFASRGVHLYRQPERLGKTTAQNAAVERSRGEILIFSDATTMYDPGVPRDDAEFRRSYNRLCCRTADLCRSDWVKRGSRRCFVLEL